MTALVRRDSRLGFLPLVALATISLGSCSRAALPAPERKVVVAVQEYLESMDVIVPDELILGAPPEDALEALEHPSCPVATKELKDSFRRVNSRVAPLDQNSPHPLDWLAALMVGVEPEVEQGLFTSLPAFSSDGDNALVYVETRAPLGGGGAYFLLRRSNGRWQITDSCEVWVS